MFEILVIIFIGVVIYKRVQSIRQENGSLKGSNSQPNTVLTPPVNNTTRPPVQPMALPRPIQTASKNKSAQQATQYKSAQQAAQYKPAQQATQYKSSQQAMQHKLMQEAREDGNSTTAYLTEKAEADAREHAKEKYEEQKRLYETRGGLAAAERYLDGDSIPQGKKCIKCGYCGAENLVPMIPRTKYSCYFCREPLQI